MNLGCEFFGIPLWPFGAHMTVIRHDHQALSLWNRS